MSINKQILICALLLLQSAHAYLFAKPESGDFEASMILSVVIFFGFAAMAIRSKPEMLIFAFVFAFFVGASASTFSMFSDIDIDICGADQILEHDIFLQLAVRVKSEQIDQWIKRCENSDVLYFSSLNQNKNSGSRTTTSSRRKSKVTVIVNETKVNETEVEDRKSEFDDTDCRRLDIIKQSKWCLDYYFADSKPDSSKINSIDSWVHEILKTKNIAKQKVYLFKLASLVKDTFGIRSISDMARTKAILDYISGKNYQISQMVGEILIYGNVQSTTVAEWIMLKSENVNVITQMANSSIKDAFSIKRILLVISFGTMMFVLFMSLASKLVRSYSFLVIIIIISFGAFLIIF